MRMSLKGNNALCNGRLRILIKNIPTNKLDHFKVALHCNSSKSSGAFQMLMIFDGEIFKYFFAKRSQGQDHKKLALDLLALELVLTLIDLST